METGRGYGGKKVVVVPFLLLWYVPKQCVERSVYLGLLFQRESTQRHIEGSQTRKLRDHTSNPTHKQRMNWKFGKDIDSQSPHQCHASSVKATPHKGSITVPPTVQIPEPTGDISHTNHHPSHQVQGCNCIEGIISKFDNNSVFQNS